MKNHKISNRVLLIPLVISFLMIFVSCQNKVTKIEMDDKNAIEYIFNTTKDSIYKKMNSRYTLLGLSLLTINDSIIIPPEILEFILKKNNEQDICLLSEGAPMYSKLYKKNGKFLEYLVSFYLHLESVNETQTKVTIKTINPRVIYGRNLLPSLPHLVRNTKKMTVELSTIEEYEILLEIGKLVGEKNMPPLKLPK